MPTKGFFLKRTVDFLTIFRHHNDDENPQPLSPTHPFSKLNNQKSEDSSTTPNISNAANQDIVEDAVAPTEIITPTSVLISST